jgi:FK506-binding protein 4/5
VAEFTIAPRFAYDDLGAPPLVPPDATLVFEVELMDWENKSDVLGDGRRGIPVEWDFRLRGFLF